MGEEKMLGRISQAEFGTVDDYPFLLGLTLSFTLGGGGSGIGDGGKYCVNISPACRWSPEERLRGIAVMVERVAEILKAAKVSSVSDLKGIPVEVSIGGGVFKDFRILTEVL